VSWRYLLGVLEIICGSPGDFLSVLRSVYVGVLEIFGGCLEIFEGFLEIFNRCPGDICLVS